MSDKQSSRSLSVAVWLCMAGLGLIAVRSLASSASNVSAISSSRPALQSPLPTPQLSLFKTADANAPKAGDTLNYTLTYANNYTGVQASHVRLYDFLPAGVDVLSTNPPAALWQDGVLLFTAPSVGPGTGNVSANVRVRVPEGYEQLYNHVLIMADGVEPVFASLLTPVTQQPSDRLRLTKLGYSTVLTNSELVYTLRCDNISNASVSEVTVVDVLPAGVSFIAASPSPDASSSKPLMRWSLGDLGQGESKTIVVTTTSPAQTGVITNSAVANAWQNVLTQTLFATQVVGDAAILRVYKSASAQAIDPGRTLVYTLRYENGGKQPATGVRLTDTLPSGVTFVGAFPQPTTRTGQQCAWDLGGLNQAKGGQIVITTTVQASRGSVLHNVADITAQPGSFPGHDELDTPVPMLKLFLPIVMKH
jgi:uncharacterized repeat protein (TIGR01451 family)